MESQQEESHEPSNEIWMEQTNEPSVESPLQTSMEQPNEPSVEPPSSDPTIDTSITAIEQNIKLPNPITDTRIQVMEDIALIPGKYLL